MSKSIISCPICKLEFYIDLSRYQSNSKVSCSSCNHAFSLNQGHLQIEQQSLFRDKDLQPIRQKIDYKHSFPALHLPILCITLFSILLIQSVLALTPALLEQSSLSKSCKILYCTYHEYPNLSLEASIEEHPNYRGFLVANGRIKSHSATFINDLPNIKLSFTNIHSKIVAARIFTPSEYLPKIIIQRDNYIFSGESLPIKLELLDPGEQATGYQFSMITS